MGEIRRNCWTCRHGRPGQDTVCRDPEHNEERDDWIMDYVSFLANAPSKRADGCPGWERNTTD